MKTPPKATCWIFSLLFLCLGASAQVQWYQNQDGNNSWPNGTVATAIQPLGSASFIACYQWSISNDQFTWKISKTNMNGQEQRTFFVTGTTALVETKVGKNGVYVFRRNFPIGEVPQYTIYKLDFNLNVIDQKNISLAGDFNIFNMNAFELDKADNIYFAGDGQYWNGVGFAPASFVIKTDKNLATKWTKTDSSQAYFTRLLIDDHGTVTVINDSYVSFPDVKLKIISSDGQQVIDRIIHTDPARYSLFAALDESDDLLLYGSRSMSDTTQAVYLYKISRNTGVVVFQKNLFESLGTSLMDLKVDNNGSMFVLVQQYFNPGIQLNKISRINPSNGNIYWSQSYVFDQDSCNLFRLVMNSNDRFYAVGERRSNLFSKAYTVRMKKNGVKDGELMTPDSVCFQRSHWLTDGFIDNDSRLIAVGGTQDLDTSTFMNTYLRAFAIRYNIGNNNSNPNGKSVQDGITENDITAENTQTSKLIIYPNPVQNELIVPGLKPGEYDKLFVYNMNGMIMTQQSISGTTAFVNISGLDNGFYLLVLRSSALKQEKQTKFMIRR